MELLSREPEMSTKALILIANMLFALTACATPAAPPQPAVSPVPVAAAAAPATALPAPPFSSGGYLTPVALNLYRLLPPPPEAGSAQERSELDELLHLQATRTPAEVRRAQADATISIFRFADALGNPPDFTPKALPRVAELFDRVLRDENLFMDTAKDAFGRPRPFVTEERLNPVVPRPPSASYPSGHTTWAIAVAIVLADMVPERRAQIFARADEYAHRRWACRRCRATSCIDTRGEKCNASFAWAAWACSRHCRYSPPAALNRPRNGPRRRPTVTAPASPG
jgi:acid phosphatase (class A)